MPEVLLLKCKQTKHKQTTRDVLPQSGEYKQTRQNWQSPALRQTRTAVRFADHSVSAARRRFDGEASVNSSKSSALSLLIFWKPLLFVFFVRSAGLHSQKEGGTRFLKSMVSAAPEKGRTATTAFGLMQKTEWWL